MAQIYSNKLFIILVSLTLGIFSSFSLPPYNYFFINFFTFPFFFYLLVYNLNKKLINNFLIGWLYGFGYFLFSLYWISNSLKFDENFENFIILSMIFIPALLSIFYGLFSILIKFLNIKINFSSIMIFSLSLSIIEYLRGTIFGGFPWNLITFSLTHFTSSIQLLNLIGTYSLNLLVITFYCLPIVIICKISKFKKFTIILSASLILIVNFYYGQSRIDQIEKAEKKIVNPSIKLISPKFNIERFLVEEPKKNKLKELIEMSYPINKDLILIYPEGMTDLGELNKLNNNLNKISNELTDNSKIILGITLDDGDSIFNSLALINKELIIEETYKKNNLVPFGEFLPFEKYLINFGLKKITQGYRSFNSSKERNIINVGSISFLPLICYEIIFSGQLNKNKQDYDIILNISEDGWFGDSIGPFQHFSHSIFRSIEEGKDILRVANNGITAHVSLNGKVNKKINTTEKGSIEINSISKPFPTIFSIYGNKIFFFLVFFYISLIFFLKKIK